MAFRRHWSLVTGAVLGRKRQGFCRCRHHTRDGRLGMHIAASAVLFWLARLVGVGRRFAWPCVMAILVIYAGLCGWTASVMRPSSCWLLQIWKLVGQGFPARSSDCRGRTPRLEDRTVLGQPGYLLSLPRQPASSSLQNLDRISAMVAPAPLAGLDPWRLSGGPVGRHSDPGRVFGRISLSLTVANCIFVPVILGLQAVGLVLSGAFSVPAPGLLHFSEP